MTTVLQEKENMLIRNKGSQWRKWDLHIHTKGTNKNDQFSSPTFNDFCITFFKKACENNISAIGITDYFCIENYLKTKQFILGIDNLKDDNGKEIFSISEISCIKNIYLFPNVELRMLPCTGVEKLINIHCLFNPNYVSALENDFFGNVENQDSFKMNKKGIIDYGRTLSSEDLHDNELYIKGINSFAIDPKTIKTLIEGNKKFRDNTIIAVSNSNKDGNSGNQKHYDLFENENGSLDGVRKTIYKISNAIFSTNKKDINYFLGKGKDDLLSDDERETEINKVIFERGSLKPCIVGSDAHKEDDLFSRFTWIKSELNFEGLKQIIYEPEHRVKIQADEPDYKDDKLVINSVNFICKKSIFPTETIYFNRNLNVIIGGKSSGKSILLYCIAKTLLSSREILKSEGKQVSTYKYEFDTDFDFEVEILAGIKQSINRDDSTPSILSEIKYIPQNYLSKLAEPDAKKGNELRKLVRELLLEDETYKSKYEKFINQVKANDKKREILINDFFDLKDKIKILEEDLIFKGNEKVLLLSITSNDEKVKKLKEAIGLTEEQINEYDNYNTELVETENSFNEINSDFEKLINFNSEYRDKITELIKNKNLLLTTVKNKLVKEAFIEKYKDLDNIVFKIDALNKELEVNDKGDFLEENIFKTVFESLFSRKQQLVEKLKPLLKNNEIKIQIEDLEKIISIDKQKLNQISQLKENIKKYKDALNNQKFELFNLYEDNYREYQKIIHELDGRTSILNSNKLKIEGKVKFNFPKFRKKIQEISDSRSASYSSYSILKETHTGVSECEVNHILNDLKILFSAIVEDNKYNLLSKTDSKNAIKELFEDYFFDYWEVSYDNDMLYRMSTGKASFVILMLIVGLSKSKAPILIDQPEDNLDNRSITKDLVTYLRDKKLERQIILVTHNPNVVVNADAENIIIANQKGQNDRLTSSPYQFDYINGAIENAKTHDQQETDLLKSMGIREHIADIVEGGKEAFKKREKKYGF